ncbi:MaoC family dehydratase N-terminal domain-containing protein [Neobacillus niacini]|uniref:MaoC family dehydratase N-terminal domain-containing protein n=1 Tax=Neobacillus niacini TaxID=86668 RepID=UPI002FFF5311
MSVQVTEQLKSLVGTEFYRIEGVPVERGKIREFAMAIQEDNPIFYEEQAAHEAGLPSVPAPLTFSQTINFWNTHGSPVLNFGLDLRYVLHGGQEYEYYKPIFAGDTLNVACRLADVYEKAGSRGGKMLFVVLETEFSNQQGEKVLSSKQILIQTGGVVKREE